ncbi:hypothetical protein IWW48_005536 [Coemansia sp. RSA 1200]|nr:hypothetical protein IWW48_005536 [Coemansia sp. RSA 1200]
MAAMDPIIMHRQQHHHQQQHSTLSQIHDISQATSTAELTKMIRQVSDALDAEMRAPNANYFAPHTEALRCDCLELFRKLLVRNPYSSQRKDILSKMWFRAIYPFIEQYRANIRQFETMLHAAAAASGASSSPSPLSSSSAATAFSTVAAAAAAATSAAVASSSGNPAAKPDTITTRRELSKWRARFQTFLQASAGMLLRMVVEMAETHALVAAGSLECLSDCALDARTLATHVYGFDFVDCLRSELHPSLSSTQRAALAIISKLLTHLGDLSRYRILYTSKKQQHQRQTNNNSITTTATGDGASSSNGSYSTGDNVWWAAKNFYRAAIKLAPHRGQPHNQIAVIYGYEKNSLEGVFHYYRALSAQYDFMPSEANLRTILDNALRAVDNLDGKNKHNLSQQQQQSPNKQQRQRHQERRQLRFRASAKSVDESDESNVATGYAYYDKQIYARFTHLRYLFAFNCPTSAAIAALGSENPLDQTATDQKTITPEMEEQISTEIGLACGKFVHGAKSGLIDERQALITQAVHLVEQQRLACLNANAAETRLHDPVIARLSAHLSMRIAEHVCFGISRSISDAMGAHKGGNGNGSASSAARLAIKSPSDLLSNPSRRTLPLLVQTLIWTVSACIRVVKDSTSRDYLAAHGGAPITELKSQVFKVIRDCGLLANMRKLRTAMEQAHGKISRRSPLTSPVAWKDTLLSMDNLTHHIWTLSNASGGTSAQRGYEPELLAGWQLPDGSVWGRLAPVGETDQHSKLRPLSPLADISEDTRLLALWRQLYWLLSVLLEALPMVLDLVDREESARQTASGSATQKQQQRLGRADEEVLLHEATPDDSEDGGESNNDEDEDDEDAENETICFQGRPQWQQRQPSSSAATAAGATTAASPKPQLHSVASAASSVALEGNADVAGPIDSATQAEWQSSVPPTPQMAQQTYKSLRQPFASNNNSSISDQLLLSQLWRIAAPRHQKEQGSLKEDAELESTESAMRMIEQMELAKETRAYGSGTGGQSVAAGFSPEMAPYYGRPSGVGAGPIGSRFQGSAIAAATAIPSASSAAALDGISSITTGGGGQSYTQHTMAAQKTSGAMSPDDVYRARQHQQQQQQHSVSAVTSALYSPQLLPVSLIGNGSSGGKPNAMDAWQQYQMEHQRKVVLQQQLEQQQKLQHQLHQRLAGQGIGTMSFLQQQQQQQKHVGAAAALGSVRDGDDYQMDTTTASVVSMALSAPNEKQQRHRAGGDLSSVYSAYGNFSANGRVQSMATAAASSAAVAALSPSLSSSGGYYQTSTYNQQQQPQPQQQMSGLPAIAHTVSYPHTLGNTMMMMGPPPPPSQQQPQAQFGSGSGSGNGGGGGGNSSVGSASSAYPWASPMMSAALVSPSGEGGVLLPANGNGSSSSNGTGNNHSSLAGYLSPMLEQRRNMAPQHRQQHFDLQPQQYPQYRQYQHQHQHIGASSGSATHGY